MSSTFCFNLDQSKILSSSNGLKLELCGKELTLSLPNDKYLDWFKMKELVDDKINVIEKLKSVLGRVENIVGKGENASNQHFLLFLQCFQKASFPVSLKVGIVWYGVVRVIILLLLLLQLFTFNQRWVK